MDKWYYIIRDGFISLEKGHFVTRTRKGGDPQPMFRVSPLGEEVPARCVHDALTEQQKAQFTAQHNRIMWERAEAKSALTGDSAPHVELSFDEIVALIKER